MAKLFNIFSTNNNNPIAQNLQRITEMEGVADCALLDRAGNLIHRSSSSIGLDDEFIACFDDIQGLMAIATVYLGNNTRCENIHLYCTTGEVVLWDLGPFVFFVTGHGIQCPAELRLRVSILKNDIITNPKLQKYCQTLPTQTRSFKPDESELALYSALIGGKGNNG
jgi:hypothetical protein